jgi:hypothetical protein
MPCDSQRGPARADAWATISSIRSGEMGFWPLSPRRPDFPLAPDFDFCDPMKISQPPEKTKTGDRPFCDKSKPFKLSGCLRLSVHKITP